MIEGLAIAGGLTMLYNTGNYAYDWYIGNDKNIEEDSLGRLSRHDSSSEEEDLEILDDHNFLGVVINGENISRKELKEVNQMDEIKKVIDNIKLEHDICYEDVITELKNLFKYQYDASIEEFSEDDIVEEDSDCSYLSSSDSK